MVLQTVGKRKPYLKLSPKKAIIGKYAAENGIVSALFYFAPVFPYNVLRKVRFADGKRNIFWNSLGRRKVERI